VSDSHRNDRHNSYASNGTNNSGGSDNIGNIKSNRWIFLHAASRLQAACDTVYAGMDLSKSEKKCLYYNVYFGND
ncbi:hypothetical protein BGX21_001278, partial [Mortierella sp. AD011]